MIMKINSDQLPKQLTKSHPGFWLATDEVFLQQINADLIRDSARQKGFSARTVFHIDNHFNWDEVYQQLNNRSLFNDTQLLELRFIQDKFSDADRKALQACCDKLNPDVLLLVLTHKIEAQTQKAKWFDEVCKKICFIPIWPISPQQYLTWLNNRSTHYQLNIEANALQLLAKQTQGNVWAADQILQQLKLLYTHSITQEMMAELTFDAMQTELFTFVDVFLGTQPAQAFHHLQLLETQGVEPILIIWALARELRTLNSLLLGANPYIWPQRQALMASACKRFPINKVQALFTQLAQIDLFIKGVKQGCPWLALERLLIC